MTRGRGANLIIRAFTLMRHSSFGFRHFSPQSFRGCKGFYLLGAHLYTWSTVPIRFAKRSRRNV